MARFVFDCPLRWSDMDSFGHVNNSRFLTLYEEARVAMMFRAAGDAGVSSFIRDGVVVARHEIDYVRPVDYGDPIRIELWVDEVRNSSFRMAYELFAAEKLASKAVTVLVPYDLSAGRSRRVSVAEREFLDQWRDDNAV